MAGFGIDHYPKITRTPAVPFLAQAWVSMLDHGLVSDDFVMVNWDHGAVVALEDSCVIGVITYSHEEWCKGMTVHLGYVNPAHRGEGVYRRMWQRLVERAQELGVVKITGATRVGNKPMRAVAAKLGRTEELITTTFDVPKKKGV